MSIDVAALGYTLEATAAGLTPDTSDAVDIGVGAPAKLAFTVQPSNAVAGVMVDPTVQVVVQDAFGSTVTTATDAITVALDTDPSDGTATPTGAGPVSAVNGVATFPNVSVDKVAAGYTLTASGTGLSVAVSEAFDISVAAAAQLAFTEQPTSTIAGTTVTPQVQVTVQDDFGNPVTTATDAITLGFDTDPSGGSATLTGGGPIDAVAGIATFDVSIDIAALGYTLAATAAARTPATSDSFDVTAAASDRLLFTVEPTSANVNQSISPSVEVAAVDMFGNIVTDASDSVTLSLEADPSGGTATLFGEGPVSPVNGVATFPNVSVDVSGAGFTLVATAPGLPSDTSGAFSIGLVSWINAAGGSWTVPTNWSTGQVPGAGDEVVIDLDGTYTVTVFSGPGMFTVASLALGGTSGKQTLSTDRTFTATDSVTVGANGAINLAGTGGITSDKVTNAGSITANTGTIRASLDNQGALVATGPGTLDIVGSFTTSGTITIDSGQTLTIQNGTFVYEGGNITGDGELRLRDVTATLLSDLSPGPWTLTLGDRNLGGDVTVNGSATLTNVVGSTLNLIGAGSININVPVVNQGTLSVETLNSTILNGPLTTEVGSTIQIGETESSVVLTVANGFTNNGLTELGHDAASTRATIVVNGGALTNSVTGTISGAPSSAPIGQGAGRIVTATLINQGTVTFGGGGAVIDADSATHSNSGTIEVTGGSLLVLKANGFDNTGTLAVTGGDLHVELNGAGPGFTTSGTVTIGAGQILAVRKQSSIFASNGTFSYTAGTIEGAGTLVLSNLTATIAIDLATPPALDLWNVTLNGAGTLINGPDDTVTVFRTLIGFPQFTGPTEINVAVVNQGVILLPTDVVNVPVTFNGPLTTAEGSTIRITSTGEALQEKRITVAAGFTNNGLIELSGDGSPILLEVKGTLTNSSTGTIAAIAGPGVGARVLRTRLDNQGTLSVEHALTVDSAGATHTNSGAIAVGGNGILSVTGNLSVTSSAILDVELGGVTAGSGYGRLNVSGTATLNGALVVDTINNFSLVGGDKFAIMTFGVRSGNFATVTLPAITGLEVDTMWTLGQTPDSLYVVAASGVWTWVSGSSSGNQSGVYGTQGSPASANVPGARNGSVSWIDGGGNLWLFGGAGHDVAGTLGFLNDLWRFDGTNWTWVSGSSSVDQAGVYGTLGSPDPANVPGARVVGVSWMDVSGNLWLFGGAGFDVAGTVDGLNDLWRFDGTNWTWVSGSSSPNQAGIYGNQGSPDPANVPGARGASGVSWIDGSGNLWLFGGFGRDGGGIERSLNDLWRFDGTNWTWISGSSSGNQAGVYGTPGSPDPANVPGARFESVSWIDGSGNLWLFGGVGYDIVGGQTRLNDLWRFVP